MACNLTLTNINNANFCKNIGGIKSLSIGTGTTFKDFDTRPERSHAEIAYSYNNETGVGIWEGDIYVYLGAASSTNRETLNDLCQAGVADVKLKTNGIQDATTSVQYHTWTFTNCYTSAASINTGTKWDDGTETSLKLHVRMQTTPTCVASSSIEDIVEPSEP